MKAGIWSRLLLIAALLPAGCKGFWDAPSGSTSYTMTNSGNITVAPGSTGTSTITVTPANSFTGTVALTCSITSTPTSATDATTCSLSPTSVSISGTAEQTSTLTASTQSTTTTGAYQITVTGTSGSVSNTTNLCAEVSSSGGSCSASAGNSSGVFYVLNYGTKQIVAYSISSGTVGQVGNIYTFGSAPISIAIAPNGGFLYVGTAANGIFLFDIGSNGALTQVGTNPISQDVAASMQVDSTGSWLVDAAVTFAGVQLNAIPITSSGAVNLSANVIPLVVSGSTVYQLAISPDNKNVFVTLGSNGTDMIPFNSGSSSPFGTARNIGVKLPNSGGSAVSVAVDPSNRLLYIGEIAALSGSSSGGLRAINYSTLYTTPIEISGSPFATGGLAPYAIAPTLYGSNKGSYVYVANRTVSNSSTGSIAGFSVATSGTSATLSALGSAAPAGITPLGLAQDSTGNYLLVVNSGGGPDLQGFTFDASTAGKLDSAISIATGTDPVQASSIAALP